MRPRRRALVALFVTLGLADVVNSQCPYALSVDGRIPAICPQLDSEASVRLAQIVPSGYATRIIEPVATSATHPRLFGGTSQPTSAAATAATSSLRPDDIPGKGGAAVTNASSNTTSNTRTSPTLASLPSNSLKAAFAIPAASSHGSKDWYRNVVIIPAAFSSILGVPLLFGVLCYCCAIRRRRRAGMDTSGEDRPSPDVKDEESQAVSDEKMGPIRVIVTKASSAKQSVFPGGDAKNGDEVPETSKMIARTPVTSSFPTTDRTMWEGYRARPSSPSTIGIACSTGLSFDTEVPEAPWAAQPLRHFRRESCLTSNWPIRDHGLQLDTIGEEVRMSALPQPVYEHQPSPNGIVSSPPPSLRITMPAVTVHEPAREVDSDSGSGRMDEIDYCFDVPLPPSPDQSAVSMKSGSDSQDIIRPRRGTIFDDPPSSTVGNVRNHVMRIESAS